MLYSERYLNKVFTREDATSLTTMWDGISGNLITTTMYYVRTKSDLRQITPSIYSCPASGFAVPR